MSTDQTATARTKLSRRWLIKMSLTTLAMLAFGGWAMFDLVHAYPKRGRDYAAAKQLEYLRAADVARSLFEASVAEPREALDTLRSRPSLTESERAKLEWLEALAVPGLGMLKAEHTVMESPRETLASLEERLASAEQPRQLSAFDLPSQWLILFVCWGVGLYLIVLWVRVATKKYTWVAAEQKLGLPGGATLVPTDLADVDKRKWHKFYVTLEINDTHPSLAGKAVALDLYRYVPLEEWVLKMEQITFPDRQEEEASDDDASVEPVNGGDTPTDESADADKPG